MILVLTHFEKPTARMDVTTDITRAMSQIDSQGKPFYLILSIHIWASHQLDFLEKEESGTSTPEEEPVSHKDLIIKATNENLDGVSIFSQEMF